jgi:hypothetical protein
MEKGFPMNKIVPVSLACGLAFLFLFGCGPESGEPEWTAFYSEKIAAVNGAANALAAARNTALAAAELEKGYKILREAIAQEAFLLNRHPRAKEDPEIRKLQEDYLAASDKFSREIEALPARLVSDRTLIEALKKIGSRNKPM